MRTASPKLTDEIKLKAVNAGKESCFYVETIRQASINTEFRKTFMSEAKATREATLKTNEAYEAKIVFEPLKYR
jgi:hypothetical protein